MFKRKIPYFIVSFVLVLLLSGLIQKEKLNKIIPELKQENAQDDTFHIAAELARTRYSYKQSIKNYSFTLLEFDSTVYKPMERVQSVVKIMVEEKIT